MKNNIKIILLVLISILYSCSSDEGTGVIPVNLPKAATLVFPLENAECNEGEILSESESKVTFEWNAAEFTNSYSVVLKNLNSGQEESFNSNSTTLDITIQRGTPYSWEVISKSNSTNNTAKSETWKFYNSGPGAENYAPFPADVISPPMGFTLNASSVDLIWKGSDADNDIKEYEVYMGTNNPPTTPLNTVNNTEINGVALSSNTLYYWQVVTIDAHNNSTKSSVFEFKTK